MPDQPPGEAVDDRAASSRKRDTAGIVRFLFRAASVWPWVNLASIYLFALAVRTGFGRWPKNELDGVDLPVVHVALPFVMTFYEITITGLPLIWATMFMIVVFAKQTNKITLSTVVFMTGILATWFLGRTDPWGFLNWLLH